MFVKLGLDQNRFRTIYLFLIGTALARFISLDNIRCCQWLYRAILPHIAEFMLQNWVIFHSVIQLYLKAPLHQRRLKFLGNNQICITTDSRVVLPSRTIWIFLFMSDEFLIVDPSPDHIYLFTFENRYWKEERQGTNFRCYSINQALK